MTSREGDGGMIIPYRKYMDWRMDGWSKLLNSLWTIIAK